MIYECRICSRMPSRVFLQVSLYAEMIILDAARFWSCLHSRSLGLNSYLSHRLLTLVLLAHVNHFNLGRAVHWLMRLQDQAWEPMVGICNTMLKLPNVNPDQRPSLWSNSCGSIDPTLAQMSCPKTQEPVIEPKMPVKCMQELKCLVLLNDKHVKQHTVSYVHRQERTAQISFVSMCHSVSPEHPGSGFYIRTCRTVTQYTSCLERIDQWS